MLDIIQRSIFISSFLSLEFLTKIRKNLNLDDFNLKYLRLLFEILINYYDKYKDIPSFDLYIELVNDADYSGELLNELETCIYLDIRASDYSYICDAYSEHVEIKKYQELLLNATTYLQTQDLPKLKETLQTALISNSVTEKEKKNIVYFSEDYINNKVSEDFTTKISTGYRQLDACLGSGLSKGELCFLLSPPNRGKSFGLLNLAGNYIYSGYNVFFVSVEMSKNTVVKRFDQFFTGYCFEDTDLDTINSELFNIIDDINFGSFGKLVIQDFPSRTLDTTGLRQWILQTIEETKIIPDVIVLDYADELRRNKSENIAAYEIGEIWSKLRAIATEFNAIFLTASQTTKSAMNKISLAMEDVSDSWDKMKISDVCIGLCQTPNEERDNIMRWITIKLRDGKKLTSPVLMLCDFDVSLIKEL
jgi:replicative DNA helicase